MHFSVPISRRGGCYNGTVGDTPALKVEKQISICGKQLLALGAAFRFLNIERTYLKPYSEMAANAT